jgi:hypothetical protein
MNVTDRTAIIMTNLRVVVCCVSFETVKILDPIRYYRADRVHLIHSGKKPPYIDFFNHVKEELERRDILWEDHDIYYANFTDVMKTVRGIIRKEKEEGNHIYVNVGAGPQIYSSAAMVASMMEGATPFNAPTEVFTVRDPESVFFDNGKPIGNALKVKDPVEIPTFEVKAPDQDLVKGLGIWLDVTDKYKSLSTTEVMRELERNGMLEDIWEDERRRKRSQSALMRYRRNFQDKWEDLGWIEKDSRGKYSITEQGRMMLEIFG